ncbi:DUF58 domain-containing protein [Anaerosporobacter sp.]
MKIYKYILIGFLIVTTIFVSNHGGNVSYALFYLAIILPIISVIYTLYVYQHFRIYQMIDHKTIVKGELVPYRFTVSNEYFITYRSIQLKFYDDKSQVVGGDTTVEYTLLPGESIEKKTNLRCNYRGEYEVGIKMVVITDFLRLISITFPIQSKYRVMVLPRVLNLSRLRILPLEKDAKRTLTCNNPEQIEMDNELRNYVYGDSLKRIHWKASAKKQTMQTRKMTQNPRQEMNLYIDLCKLDVTGMDQIIIEDKMIEAELAIVKYCQKMGVPINVFYQQDGPQKRRILNAMDFNKLYQESPKIKFNQKVSVHELLSKNVINMGKCLVLVHKIEDALSIQLQRLKQNRAELVLLYFTSELEEEEKVKIGTLRSIGIYVREILREEELVNIL